jgi:hypothetical protein
MEQPLCLSRRLSVGGCGTLRRRTHRLQRPWPTPAMEELMTTEAVYQRGQNWFHLDETGREYGPFASKEEAEKEFKRYIHYLETGEILPKEP